MTGTTSTIAVFGATGRQGGAVSRELLRQGWAVRAVSRHPGGEGAARLRAEGMDVVAGDLTRPESIEAALRGVHGVFGVTDFWEHGYETEVRMGRNLVDVAQSSDVEHFVFSSVGGTDRTVGLGITHFDSKRAIEACLRESNLSYTIFRPVTFYENFVTPRFRRQICNQGVFRFCIEPERSFQMVAMSDVGVFVTKAFTDPDAYVGRAIELASDRFTMIEFAETLGRTIGRPVRYRKLSVAVQWIVAAYVGVTRSSGQYKVGRSLIDQFKWNNASRIGGWDADLPSLKSQHPDLLSSDQWAASIDWRAGL